MSFKKEFNNLVKNSHLKSEEFYKNNDSTSASNPYYIGFGNPNSDILLIGKEKSFDIGNKEALKYESIENPSEWNYYVKNSANFNKEKFSKDAIHYLNAFYPYEKVNKGGSTWSKYESLVNRIFGKKRINHNDFFKDAFLTEVNYTPSKQSQIRKFDEKLRQSFLKHPFYKSFKITILGCADYLDRNEIEEIFDVQFDKDLTEKHKLIIYKNSNRILANTRQLSTSVPNLYLQKIADQVTTYL
jgi:hypothetical protein